MIGNGPIPKQVGHLTSIDQKHARHLIPLCSTLVGRELVPEAQLTLLQSRITPHQLYQRQFSAPNRCQAQIELAIDFSACRILDPKNFVDDGLMLGEGGKFRKVLVGVLLRLLVNKDGNGVELEKDLAMGSHLEDGSLAVDALEVAEKDEENFVLLTELKNREWWL